VSEPGQLAPALLLTSQAEIIDIIMVARTGTEEFMLTAHPDTASEVFEWLLSHSQIADEAGAVFADLEISDQTDALATLALYGGSAAAILDELTSGGWQTALDGRAALGIVEIGRLSVMLVKWPFLQGGSADGLADSSAASSADPWVYEIHLPKAANAELQNILLGFAEVDPESFDDYRQRRKAAHTWFSASERAAYTTPSTPGLLTLLRETRDFVGAKALFSFS
jgi:hypothetical protein